MAAHGRDKQGGSRQQPAPGEPGSASNIWTALAEHST